MNFAIKLLHEPKHGNLRRVYGYSGLLYLFRWRQDAKSYVYTPTSQAQVDDLFKAQGRQTQLYFAPANADATSPEAVPPPSPELVETCRQLGLRISEDDDNATVQRLLTAYSQGLDKEKPIRLLYEAAMMQIGLLPTEVPPAGYFDAQQMEQYVIAYLNWLSAPPPKKPKKAPTQAPPAETEA